MCTKRKRKEVARLGEHWRTGSKGRAGMGGQAGCGSVGFTRVLGQQLARTGKEQGCQHVMKWASSCGVA